LSQVGSSNEFDLSCTYFYLFGNKYSKYELRTFLIFLMAMTQSVRNTTEERKRDVRLGMHGKHARI
jgi:hypothetical protein